MNIFADRVKETTTTTGTGDITLLGAVTQFVSFNDAVTNGDAVSYAIVGQTGTEWEVGIGTFTAPSTIVRASVVASSNANAAVSFSAGTKDVFITFSAADVADVLNRSNHTGTQSADTLTDGTTNKAFLATERTKLAGVATGATANSADATLLARANHTGTQDADTITDGTTNKAYTATEKTKLAGIATGATANSSDATLLDRANHTGTQAVGTITGLATVATSGSAADLTGTLADVRLSANVPLLNAANTFTANGAASTSARRMSGTVFTGGTGTTTYPFDLIAPSGVTMPTTWSTSGTMQGAVAPTGFAGNFLHYSVNGAAAAFVVKADGSMQVAGGSNVDVWITTATGTNGSRCFHFNGLLQFRDGSGNQMMAMSYNDLRIGPKLCFNAALSAASAGDLLLNREAAAIMQQGDDAASPTAQTFKGPDSRAGTDTNTAGGILNIAAGRGTGTAAGGELRLQTAAPTSTGTAAGTLTTRVAISGTAITDSLPHVLPAYTLTQLNALTGLVADMFAVCTDATAPTYLTAITGGGAVRCPAYYNGTAWVAH